MEDYINRMEEEYKELNEKITKLRNFLDRKKRALTGADYQLMEYQLEAMVKYKNILGIRIEKQSLAAHFKRTFFNDKNPISGDKIVRVGKYLSDSRSFEIVEIANLERERFTVSFANGYGAIISRYMSQVTGHYIYELKVSKHKDGKHIACYSVPMLDYSNYYNQCEKNIEELLTGIEEYLPRRKGE